MGMLYLHLPMTQGAQKLYVKFIRPFVQKHGGTIDAKFGAAMNKASDGLFAFLPPSSCPLLLLPR